MKDEQTIPPTPDEMRSVPPPLHDELRTADRSASSDEPSNPKLAQKLTPEELSEEPEEQIQCQPEHSYNVHDLLHDLHLDEIDWSLHAWRQRMKAAYDHSTYKQILRNRAVLLLRRIARRAVLTTLALLFVLVGGTVAMLQLKSTRDWLRGHLLQWLNERTTARVEFDDWEGNFIGGLTFRGVCLITAGDTALAARSLTLRYDLQALLTRSIVINRIALDTPTVKLLRGTDSTWNVQHILPAADTTKPTKPFAWTISVRDLNIAGGTLTVRDSLAANFYTNDNDVQTSSMLASTSLHPRIHFSRLRLDGIALSVAAHLQFKERKHSVTVNQCAFTDSTSRFVLQNLALSAEIDTSHLELFNARLQTTESALRLNLLVDSVNVFKPLKTTTWKHKPVQLSLQADSLSARDLQRYTPAADVLNGSPALRLEASGTYGDINLARLEIVKEHHRTNESEKNHALNARNEEGRRLIHLSGRVQNLHLLESQPNALHIDAKLRPMRVSYADVQHYLPALCAAGVVPNLSGLGVVEIASGSFLGAVNNFRVTLVATSAAGGVELDGTVDARADTLKYDASLRTINLNFAPILRNPSLATSINAQVQAKGQGTTLKTLASALHVESSRSLIAGRSYDYLLLNARAHDGGRIDLDMLKALWNRRKEFDEEHYTETALPPAQLIATGWLNLQDVARPEYRFDARTTNFDMHDLAPELGIETDATMQINVAGRGFHVDSLQGNLRIAAQEFTAATRTFEPFTINIRLERWLEKSLYNRKLQLSSDFADAEVNGEFTIPSFIKAFTSQVDNIIFEVRRKYHWTRDSANAAVTEQMYIPTQTTETPLDATFRIAVRDLSLVSLFTGNVRVLAAGELRGSVRGSSRRYMTRIDSSYLDSFLFTDGTVRVNVWKAHLMGDFYNQTSGDSLNAVGGWARVRCDSAFAFDDMTFPKASMDARYSSEEISFNVRSDYADILRFHVQGALDASTHEARLRLDTLMLTYFPERMTLSTIVSRFAKPTQATQKLVPMSFTWRNIGSFEATLAAEGLTFHDARIQRVDAEEIALNGLWWFDHFNNFQMDVRRMQLADVYRLLPKESRIDLLKPLRGRLHSLSLRANGVYERPELGLTMLADSIMFNGAFVGNAVLSLQHRDSMVTGTAEFATDAAATQSNPQSSSNANARALLVKASAFPLNCALSPVAERIATGRPIDIRFDTEAFPMPALAMFIPGINTVRGALQAHLSITGETQENIIYQGTARLLRGSFVTDATNLRYFAEGRMSLYNNTVKIEEFTIANDSLDYPRGRAVVTGTAKLRGFDIDGFDISVQAPSLLVLGNASRITMPNMYGDVVIQTGVGGSSSLRFYGTLQEPYLRGDVNIMDANLVLPDSKSTKTQYNAFCFETLMQQSGRPVFIARDCQPNEYLQSAEDTLRRPRPQTESSTEAVPSVPITSLVDSTLAEYHEHSEHQTLQQSSSFLVPTTHAPAFFTTATTQMQSSSLSALASVRRVEPSFAEKIDYDVNVNMKGNFFITMNFSAIDQLVASVAQENPDRPLRYVQTPDNPDEPKLYGAVRVREGSKYNFYRIFNTTGTLAFTSGALDNPQLSLNAVLRGQRISPIYNSLEEYTVLMEITGTKKLPQVKFSYFIADRPGVGDPAKVQNDAIMLMVVGKTQDELLLRTAVSEATTQTSSSVASKALTDILQGTGIIRSADIYFASAQNGAPLNLSQARVQLTGEISDLGVTWQVGNDIGSNAALNPSFTIDIPLRSLVNVDAFRNVMLQVNRSAVNFNALSRQQRELEVKMTVQNRW
jgi:hypothetical protein